MPAHRHSRSPLGCVSVAVSLALALGALASVGRAADVAPSAQLLPADTFAYITVHDVPAFKKAWGETQYGLLLADPDMQPFLEDIMQEVSGVLASWEEQIGLTAAELFDLPQGQLSLALMPSSEAGVGFVAVIELGENQPDAERLFERLAEDLAEEGEERRIEVFEGTELVIFDSPLQFDEGDPAARIAPSNIAYFMKDQTLVIGWDVEQVKGVITRWAGDAEVTLADNPVFNQIAQRTATDDRTPQLEWFLDPIGILMHTMSMAGVNQQAQVAGMLPMLGFDKLKGIGGASDLVVGPNDTVWRMHVAIEGPRQGLLKLLEFPIANLQPEPWVPNDVASYMSLNWDLDAAWRAVSELYNQFSGPGAFEKLLESAAGGPNGANFDIKTDVIDPISGRITVVSDFQEPITITSQRTLVGVALDDAQTFSSTLDKLMQQDGGRVQKREFQGHVIYDIETPGAGLDGEVQATQMGVTVAQDYFFFSNNVALLEKVLRSGDDVEPLAQSLDYRLVASRVPESAGGITFGRPEQSWRSLYEMIRSGELRDTMAGAAMFFPPLLNLSQAIDGEKLPEFDVVRRYLAPSGGYIESDEDGILIVGFTLRKESP